MNNPVISKSAANIDQVVKDFILLKLPAEMWGAIAVSAAQDRAN